MKWTRYLLIIIPAIVIVAYSLKVQIPKPLKDADLHIVESWISPSSLEFAAEYLVKNDIDSVYMVGVGHKYLPRKKSDSKKINYPVNLVSNGYVMMRNSCEDIQGDHIRIDIEGYSANNIGAFVLFFVNDKLLDKRLVSGRDTISIQLKEEFESLIVYFANDTYCKRGEDRNLRIYSIESIKGECKFEKRLGGVNILPEELAMTDAKKAELYLAELGYSNIYFERIERNTNKNNKTLQASLLFKEWLSKQPLAGRKLKVNIFTSKFHSERTYINYKNALKPYAEVGVITADDTFYNCDSPNADSNLLAWLDESASIIYTKLYWLFR